MAVDHERDKLQDRDLGRVLNFPLVVFSAPMKSPRQKELIASGAAQAATL